MKLFKLTAFLGIVFATAAIQQASHSAPRKAPLEKPKLVLVIVVDQFRYDYLTRFQASYTGGIARLLKQGAVFTDARYPHYPTVTAIGHATILTGATPSISGIVGNEWFEREPFIESKTSCPISSPPASEKADANKAVESVTDDSTCLIGGDASRNGVSPRRLLVSSLGDELKMAGRKSKAIGISMKDRGAILPAGRMADAAYWFSGSKVTTSSYYMPALPDWAAAFNEAKPADRFKDADWAPLDASEGSAPFCSMASDRVLDGQRVRPCQSLSATPFANTILEELAEKVIENEGLGGSADTDLLTVSFSANDIVGHAVGPDAPEVRDISIRTDRTIGKLLDFVDARLGLGSVMVVFTADHGVSPSPKVNAARKMPGGWIDIEEAKRAVNAALTAKFGAADWLHDRAPLGGFYFKAETLAAQKNASDVLREAAEAARKLPHVARVFTSDDLGPGYAGADRVSRAAALGYYRQRSADVILVPEPYYSFGGKALTNYQGGATHLSPYSYDAHVPLIFMGLGVKPGFYDAPVLVNDVAPTLATILEVETPSGSVGRMLGEIFE
jgi:predicted AlkP superfamily pyrophosphatase or phosphodiesterase